jgi:hypothetical protein
MAHIPPSEFSIPPNGDVDSNRICVSCGYDLRGLPWGSTCPECGQDPKVQAKSIRSIQEDLPLSQMPPTFIRRFALCCFTTTIVFPAIIARMVVPYAQFKNDSVGLFVDIGIAAIWVAGVYVLTSPMNHPLAIRYGLGTKGISRLIARWCSFSWVGIAVLVHAQPSVIVSICFMATIIVAAVGLISFFLLLAELSSWVRDATAKKYLEVAAWGIPLLILIEQCASAMSMPPLIVMIIFGCVIILLLGGIAGMMMLTSSVVQAISHARDFEAYQERRLQSKDSAQFPKPQ